MGIDNSKTVYVQKETNKSFGKKFILNVVQIYKICRC